MYFFPDQMLFVKDVVYYFIESIYKCLYLKINKNIFVFSHQLRNKLIDYQQASEICIFMLE